MQAEGGTSWRKALGRQGRSPRRSGGRPEEVAGPELALCLTQGLVHPPSLQLCLLRQSSGGRGPSFPPTPLFSDSCLPVALGNEEEPVSEPRSGTQTLVIEFILVPGNWIYFPCIHIVGGTTLLIIPLHLWILGVCLPSRLTADGQKNS